MKTANLFLAVILLVTAGCGGNKQSTDDFVTIDVRKNYPKKELFLQDFADVEYVPLESTDDEFLNEGWVRFVSDDFIFVRNRYEREAILIFDRHIGKALKKISRQGQGPEEYIMAASIVFDKDRKELFVMDVPSARRTLVYDLEGQFKRSFKHHEGVMYDNLYNYDQDYLFGGTDGSTDYAGQLYHIISKEDGSVVRQIDIPIEKKANLPLITPGGHLMSLHSPKELFPFKDEFILTDFSTDTVYSYSPDQGLKPFIVRTPPIHSMSYPDEVYLQPQFISDRYYFFRTEKMDVSSYTTLESLLIRLPEIRLVYDTQDKAIYEYKLYNADITNKTEVEEYSTITRNGEFVFIQSIDAYLLVEYYNKGELQGRLKEIAATLDVEDNPVIMLVKHRK